METNCKLVVFSDKAYNAIIRETFEWDPVETGGILLGHVLDNGCWIVMEVLPPGYGEGREGDNVFHEYGYFEYNSTFVNYLAKSVAEQYETPLELLGLWHRHPGSMDHFSGTDDGTNSTFAAQNQHGVISGLINVDPQLRMTMYYLAHNDVRSPRKPNYQRVDIEVGSDLIPEEYFKLRYYKGGERDLHPYAPQRTPRQEPSVPHENPAPCTNGDCGVTQQINQNNIATHLQKHQTTDPIGTVEPATGDLANKLKKNKTAIILIVALIAFLFSISSIMTDFSKGIPFLSKNDKKQTENVENSNKNKESNKNNEQRLNNDTDQSLTKSIFSIRQFFTTATENTNDTTPQKPKDKE